MKQQGRYGRLAGYRPNVAAALIGIPAATVIFAVILGLGDHFVHTRNWAGAGAILGGFVLLMLAGDLTGRRGRRLRDALGTLTAVTLIGAAFGGLYWILGRHWASPAAYGAGVAWWATLGAVMLAVSRVRRRLYWRRHGYTAAERRADAAALAVIPRRGRR